MKLINMIGLNQVPNRGLVCSYDIGNTLSYPGTGTAISDLNKTVGNLTIAGSPVYSTGNWGYLTLTQSSSPQYAGNNSASYIPGATNSVSVGIMFNSTSNGAGQNRVVFSYYGGNTVGKSDITLYLDTTGALMFYVRDGSATGNTMIFVTTTTTYNDGNWHYAVFVINQVGKSASFYIDGAFAGTASNSSWAGFAYVSSNIFGMGGDSVNTPQYFIGKISVCHYHFVALTAEEITQSWSYLIKRTLH